MCDADLDRRAFTLASLAAGAAVVAAGQVSAAAAGVVERDVDIPTPDGTTDAAIFTPGGHGPFPGVLVFTDIFGLRPATRAVGRRLASGGYLAVVPNPFYRTKRGPLLAPAVQAHFDFTRDAALLQPHLAALTPEASARDEGAWLAYMDGLPQVSRTAKLGVDGYCMGGARVVRASALRPDRVGAAMACHPGNGLVTDAPDSPHRLAGRIRARSYFALAQNDAAKRPDLAGELKGAYDAAAVPCAVEVYPADHGWTMPDSPAYDPKEAERAWTQRLALFGTALGATA